MGREQRDQPELGPREPGWAADRVRRGPSAELHDLVPEHTELRMAAQDGHSAVQRIVRRAEKRSATRARASSSDTWMPSQGTTHEAGSAESSAVSSS